MTILSMPDEQVIFGKSKESVKARELLEQIAQNKLSVLIEGESGTGKDSYADFLFSKLEGSKKKIKLDGSLLFDFSNGKIFSTGLQEYSVYLFIDGIEKLNVESQTLLLRWFENNEESFQNLRFIFFSNGTVESLVVEKKFREDLYFKMNRIKISIPALRNRKDDIASFVNHFISKFSQHHKKKIESADKVFENFLYNYHWPGNVRELENFIQRAVLFSSGSILGEKDIPPEFFVPNKITENLNLGIIPGIKLSTYEKEIIQKNLEYTNWNRNKSAVLLGISERTLYRKLREFNIVTPKLPN